jgi:hypothetical protein
LPGNREPAAINDQTEGQRQPPTECLLAGGDAGNYVLQVARADIPSGIANAAPGAGNQAEASSTFRIIPAGVDDLDSHLNKRGLIEGRINRSNAPVGTSGVQGNATDAKPLGFGWRAGRRHQPAGDAARPRGIGPHGGRRLSRDTSSRERFRYRCSADLQVGLRSYSRARPGRAPAPATM